MVKYALVISLFALGSARGQDRIAALEARIAALEARLEALTGSKPAEPEPAPAPAQRAITPVSSTGDYTAAADTETRLPVSGYMDFHVNKDRGQPFRPDFHRFV